jgi:hypothetical protein
MKPVDFDAIARAFCAVRKASDEPSAIRVALYTFRVLSPGSRSVGMGMPVVRITRVFKAMERRVLADACVPMSEVSVVAKALAKTFDWTHGPIPVVGSEVIEAHIKATMEREHIDRAKLMNGTARSVAAIRQRLWWELREAKVGPAAIARAFGRDHSTVLSGQRKHERRLLDDEARGLITEAA